MINEGRQNSEELKIQGLLDRYLNFRSRGLSDITDGNHLDEDSLTAFIEGKLSERESPFIINHLTNCGFCLHVTGELAKLNAFFAEDEPVIETAKEPTRVSEVLSSLMSRLFGSSEAAVFAHQEQEKPEKEDTEAEEDKEKDNQKKIN